MIIKIARIASPFKTMRINLRRIHTLPTQLTEMRLKTNPQSKWIPRCSSSSCSSKQWVSPCTQQAPNQSASLLSLGDLKGLEGFPKGLQWLIISLIHWEDLKQSSSRETKESWRHSKTFLSLLTAVQRVKITNSPSPKRVCLPNRRSPSKQQLPLCPSQSVLPQLSTLALITLILNTPLKSINNLMAWEKKFSNWNRKIENLCNNLTYSERRMIN